MKQRGKKHWLKVGIVGTLGYIAGVKVRNALEKRRREKRADREERKRKLEDEVRFMSKLNEYYENNGMPQKAIDDLRGEILNKVFAIATLK